MMCIADVRLSVVRLNDETRNRPCAVLDQGDTALIRAASNGHRWIVYVLLQRGAEIHRANNEVR